MSQGKVNRQYKDKATCQEVNYLKAIKELRRLKIKKKKVKTGEELRLKKEEPRKGIGERKKEKERETSGNHDKTEWIDVKV